MKEIIITGASGFVGKNLVEYLGKHNCLPIGISLRSGKMPDLSGGVQAIVHLAGKAHDIKGVEDAGSYFSVNTDLTVRLFDEFLNSPVPVFIFLSSVKAAADKVVGVLTEEVQPDPATAYGESKLKAEKYILANNIPHGKRVFILRPCMVHGPGNKGNLNLLYRFLQYGLPFPLASFNNKRSLLSVENLCFVIRELIERDDIDSGIYNIADVEPLSIQTLITLIAAILGKPVRQLKISPKLIKYLAGIGDLLHLPFNTQRLNKLTENYIVDPTKILSALKKPFPLNSIEGLNITLESFKSNQLV